MANDITYQSTAPATPPAGTIQCTDDVGARGQVPYAKLMDGTENATTVIAAGGGVEAGALRVTLASDSTGLVSVDDNGGSLTVDGTVSVSGTVTVGSHAVTNAGTFVVQVDGAALTALQLIDNIVLAEDAVHGSGDPGVQLLAVRKDTAAALAGADGDYAPLEVDANGCLHVLVNGTVTVGSHAVTNAGTFAVQVTSIAAGDNNIGNVDIVTVPTDPFGANADAASATGSISAKLRFIASTGIPITGTVTVGSHAVTNAGTFAVQDAAAEASLSIMDDWDNAASDGASVSGDVAHDTADAGEPVKLGAKAVATLSSQTLVTADDRTNVFADLDGALITRPHCALGDIVSGVAGITDGSSTTVIAAQGAGIKVYVTTIIVANSSATDVTVDIRDGTAGTVKATLIAPATTDTGGGIVVNLPVPLPFSANTIVAADPSAAASTVTVTIIGFKSKV